MLFRDRYWFLSTMYPCDINIKYQGIDFTFKSVESAYQAFKSKDIDTVKKFIKLDGFQSKKLGKIVDLRDNWDSVKVPLMETLLDIKFKDPMLKKQLMGVEEEIIHNNTHNDYYWGVCRGKGENMLGNLLMKIRDRLDDDTLIIAVTGHRPDKLGGYDWESTANEKILSRLFQVVERLLKETNNSKYIFKVGGALGIDQMMFSVAEYFRDSSDKCIEIEMCIPFEKQPTAWKSKADIARYMSQKAKADIVTYVDLLENYRTTNTSDGEYHIAKMQQRNKYMIDPCDKLIAVWDGSTGGTRNAIEYATLLKKDIILLNPKKILG